MSDSETIAQLQREAAQLRDEVLSAKGALYIQSQKLAELAQRSGELERAANIVAAQAAELCRQLRGGSMEHKRTAP